MLKRERERVYWRLKKLDFTETFRWASLQAPGYREAIFVGNLLSAPEGQVHIGLPVHDLGSHKTLS